jgi:UDP-N-acetylmuramate--alanine ligase
VSAEHDDLLRTAPSAAGTVFARPHFIAIGGMGMSGLARICVARGATVSGSDANDSPQLATLRALGCSVHVGHDAAHLPAAATCVVRSTAIRADNPELAAARDRGLPVLHRAELLAALMEGYRAIAIAGTHGKSSTSSMLAGALEGLGLDPSFAIGADPSGPGSNARHGGGELFVAEADESDRSFHNYRPSVAVVLNIEEDHHDHYASLADHLDSYALFAERIRPGGTLIVSADDAGARELTARLARSRPELRVVTYGSAADAAVRIDDITVAVDGSTVTVSLPDGDPVTFAVAVPGAHMAHNAVAALAAGRAAGVPVGRLAGALTRYQGIKRRFTTMGDARGVRVVDSYAHHPTEVRADLATARTVADARDGRVVAVFQPHLYSRTAALGADIGRALAGADVAVVLAIFGSREDPVAGVTHDIVVDAARAAGVDVHPVEDFSKAPAIVADLVTAGDLIVTMGAGSVTTLGPLILDELTSSH